jgi:hypothetical protein
VKFDATPVVNRIVTDIFKARMHCCADDHRHVINIEAADEKETILSNAM